ncbi:unnamed protein product [Tetraodon nigroviridis]|uniref:(spotted green pufferfish) hypothetical protein n=1 Tax=Tetraodon nigroviridis TaxID=99883 RepID=Q4SKB1_TETNG|nr:unnamed protein product [Tetraodon nigroviridis]
MANSDRVVLVLGGAGTVGSGIVKALLDKGFKVAVISRDDGRLERLRSLVSPTTQDNLTTVVGNVGSEDGAAEAKEALLRAVGKVTDVVSSLGFSWWQEGPPHTQTLKDLHWVRRPGPDPRGSCVLCTRCLFLICSPSPGNGDASLQHLRVLEGFLPPGERRLQLHLHLHNRRGGGEAADARHRLPDHRSRQRPGLLPGAAGGVPRGALQAQPGEDQHGRGHSRPHEARLPGPPGPGRGRRRPGGAEEQLAQRLHRQLPRRPEDCASGEEPLDPKTFVGSQKRSYFSRLTRTLSSGSPASLHTLSIRLN